MSIGLASDLRRLLGPGAVSTEPDDLERYSGDALGPFRAFRAGLLLAARPAAVAWPTSTEDVSRVLAYADRQRVPVVPCGGGTGVMGAATPVDRCILLNLQRMASLISVSREDRTARVQAGALLEEVNTASKREGMRLGHDPWSRPIATVGGAISTDGVGYTASRFGSMGDQVLGLEAVLPGGEVVRSRGVPKPSSGPSLNHLFIGSEGTLGIVTEATLQVFPRPETRLLSSTVFPEFEAGFRAVAALQAEGVRPTVVDYGDECWPGSTDETRPATLYLSFEGLPDEAEAQERRAREICLRFEGREGDRADAVDYWKTRHASGENYKREVLESLSPAEERRRRSAYRMDYLHVALPVSKVLEYRRRCQGLLSSRRILVKEWSLWGRPEYFSFLMVEEDDAGEETSAVMGDVVDQVLSLALDLGGTMEYCHGVGIKLGHLLGRELGAADMVMGRIKDALDPHRILNPGKLEGHSGV